MKSFLLQAILAIFGITLLVGAGWAESFPNPDPSKYFNDLEDSGLFVPNEEVINLELLDLSDLAGASGGNTFGFYFAGTDVSVESNLITIFDPSDDTNQASTIYFNSGVVYDNDEAAVQNTFSGSGNIGFFLKPDPVFSLPTLFTEPTLNSGIDYAGTFQTITEPETFCIGFFTDTNMFGPDTPFGIYLSGAIEPVPVPSTEPVPEPSTLLTFVFGLIGLWRFRKKLWIH